MMASSPCPSSSSTISLSPPPTRRSSRPRSASPLAYGHVIGLGSPLGSPLALQSPPPASPSSSTTDVCSPLPSPLHSPNSKHHKSCRESDCHNNNTNSNTIGNANAANEKSSSFAPMSPVVSESGSVNSNASACSTNKKSPSSTPKDSPAFRLRPRRSTPRPSAHNPLTPSPGKRFSLFAAMMAHQENSKIKNAMMRLHSASPLHPKASTQSPSNTLLPSMTPSSTSPSSVKRKLMFNKQKVYPPTLNSEDQIPTVRVVPPRSAACSITENIFVSPFVQKITLKELEADKEYSSNYISLKIVHREDFGREGMGQVKSGKIKKEGGDVKEIDVSSRVLKLIATTSPADDDDSMQMSMSEILASRLQSSSSSSSCSPPSIVACRQQRNRAKKIAIYLHGSYATQSKAELNKVINIVKFRTQSNANQQSVVTSTHQSMNVSNIHANQTHESFHSQQQLEDTTSSSHSLNNPKANTNSTTPSTLIARLSSPTLMSVSQSTSPSTQTDTHSDILPFSIVVESTLTDHIPDGINSDGDIWVPFVSITKNWEPPKDPKELNKTLFVAPPDESTAKSSSAASTSSSTPTTTRETRKGRYN